MTAAASTTTVVKISWVSTSVVSGASISIGPRRQGVRRERAKNHKPDGQGENGCGASTQWRDRGAEQPAYLFGVQEQAECGDDTKPDAEGD